MCRCDLARLWVRVLLNFKDTLCKEGAIQVCACCEGEVFLLAMCKKTMDIEAPCTWWLGLLEPKAS